MHDLTRLFRLRIGATAAIFLLCASPLTHAAERITYYHTDALGSPVAATNEQGNVVWQESYEPYGERIKKQPSSSTNSRWYTGHPLDAETGLVYAGARYYDPVLGRFMAVDPVSFNEKNLHSFNRYSYGNNNPYKYVDPDGRAAVLAPFIPAIVDVLGKVIFYGSALFAGYEGSKLINSPIFNEEKPNLVEPDRTEHILEGDKTGGGHRAGTGKPGKSEFPSDWSDDRVLGEISDVATDPQSSRQPGRGGREVVRGTRGGVDIEVIVDQNGRIITGFPTNVPRNPE